MAKTKGRSPGELDLYPLLSLVTEYHIELRRKYFIACHHAFSELFIDNVSILAH
jgi:hypothetical protein